MFETLLKALRPGSLYPLTCETPGCKSNILGGAVLIRQTGQEIPICADHMGLVFAAVVSGGLQNLPPEFVQNSLTPKAK